MGDVVSRAGIDPPHAAFAAGLHTDAVIFPFGGKGVGCDQGRVHRIGIIALGFRHQRVRQHDRPEGRLDVRLGAAGLAFEPGEQALIGRGEAVPDLLDLGHVHAAEIRERQFGKPGGDADAQAARDQFEQRPAAGRVQPVEPVGDQSLRLGPCHAVQRFDNLGQRRRAVRAPLARPDEADGFGHVADIVIGQAEQFGVHPVGDQFADRGGLDALQVEVAGQRAEGIAAVGVWRAAKIGYDQA